MKQRLVGKIWAQIRKYFKPGKRKVLGILFVVSFLVLFFLSVLGGLRSFLPYAPKITGFPFNKKVYLVIFQNEAELRPTGGFISGFARLEFNSGFPTSLTFEDVYGDLDEHAYVEPPEPLGRLLKGPFYRGHSFKDGNFNPDFAETSKDLIGLYHNVRPNEKIDGVFSVNFVVLTELLGTLGPVKVDGKELNERNVFEEIEHSINNIDTHNVEDLANRKGLMKPLATEIMKKVVINPFNLRKVSDVVTSNLARKNIMMYFDDQSIQEFVEKSGFGGRISQFDGDQFYISETNLGGMKSDRYIFRDVNYHLVFNEDSFEGYTKPKAKFSLKMLHTGIYNTPLSGFYKGYLRMFSGNSKTPRFTSDVKMNPKEQFIFDGELEVENSVLKNDEYALRLIKQPGTSDFYTITVEFPQGMSVESDDFETRENIAVFRGILNKDLTLRLKVLPDKNKPFLILQRLNEMGKIDLHFNEDLNLDFASDPSSYEIVDLNKVHPEVTDEMTVKDIKNTQRDVDIYVNGMTKQEGEHYGVILRGIRDRHGNVMKEATFTVVQRIGKDY